MNAASYRAWGVALALVGVVSFAVRPILIKLAYAYVADPVTLIALRMVFSLPFFLGTAIWMNFRAARKAYPPHASGSQAALTAAFPAVGAFPLKTGSADASLVRAFSAGGYNLQTSAAPVGANVTNPPSPTGLLLIEVYEAP